MLQLYNDSKERTLTCLIQGEALIKGEGGQILLKRGGEGGKLTKINKRP